ncbi:MAG: transcription antitermination protein NusB [Rikenellaceae bacterium]|jgi:N utilization substance protein B|nr:transcription antitermination protein NusB [Rikenellaceae bacterium]
MLSRRLLRIKVIKAIYAHFKSESDSLIVSEKNLLFSIDKTYQLYHLLLYLIVSLQRYAENRIEIGRKKHLPTPEERNPNLKFVNNRVIAQIASSDKLLDYLTAQGLGWENAPELIKKLYNHLIESEFYQSYMNNGRDDYADDLRFVIDFYTQELEDSEPLEEALEEQSIFWSDDIGFALIMAVRTLQEMRKGEVELPLLPKFRNDDDRVFALELFRKALVNNGEYFGYIDANTQNWDLDRIAYMDRVIMLTTLAELTNFPTIPVKVTLDEYIEIAKYYSTPASCTFINGVLDKIVEILKTEGKIRKEGRGLVEN